MDNIEERINKLLTQIDKNNEDINKIIDMQKEIKERIIELERKLDKNDKQKCKKIRKWWYKSFI